MNIGSRLQSEAPPRVRVLCGFRTYALIRDDVQAVARAPVAVKGAARPIDVWEVIDLGASGDGSEPTAGREAAQS